MKYLKSDNYLDRKAARDALANLTNLFLEPSSEETADLLELLAGRPLEEIAKVLDAEIARCWEVWWKGNKDYLYWDKKLDHFRVDEEAKKSGIPVNETKRH